MTLLIYQPIAVTELIILCHSFKCSPTVEGPNPNGMLVATLPSPCDELKGLVQENKNFRVIESKGLLVAQTLMDAILTYLLMSDTKLSNDSILDTVDAFIHDEHPLIKYKAHIRNKLMEIHNG